MSVTMLWLFPLAAFALISTSIADQAIDKDIVQDEAHLKEHLKNKVETSGPTTAEKQRFRWFWITDLNHDGYLDGIEIMKSLTHSHDHSNKANIIPENAIKRWLTQH
ncbi:hypothetical protein GCK32_008729 [Trichostrongylus colubriformis]|uniref:EF-hand domain-containing protein n=1 Tax=Trichostrongylus colubriformis TaxID=6319 RepID=A0AAN8FNM4_TRICO